jgi:TusA-related sulfurtransferase
MELIGAIQQEDAGAEIEVLSSDQGSRQDIPLWVKKAGHELVKVEEGSEFDRYLVRKTH